MEWKDVITAKSVRDGSVDSHHPMPVLYVGVPEAVPEDVPGEASNEPDGPWLVLLVGAAVVVALAVAVGVVLRRRSRARSRPVGKHVRHGR